jgi:large subunit ribosomal protein L4
MKKIEAPIIGKTDKPNFTLDPVIYSTHLNPKALAQVIRVYQSNAHQQTKKTKTRGEVAGSTRKIYRQKGTGGARHGSTKAPIYVGGGIAFGPTGVRAKPLHLNQKLRAKALASVLTDKVENNHLYIFDCPKLDQPSTKEIFSILVKNKLIDQNILIYSDSDSENMLISVRNLESIYLISASDLNAFQVISAKNILFTPAAAHSLEERISPQLSSK